MILIGKPLVIPAFFFRKKGILISCQSRSVVRLSVRACISASVRHVSCICISHNVEGNG